jgi:hypothetical protein
MKKQIIILSATLALSSLMSCGAPKADKIDVTSNIYQAKETSQFQVNKTFDEIVGDGTIITFPAGEDLSGYTYAYPEAQWKAVMARLPYGAQLPLSYEAGSSSSNKIAQISTAILSLGKLKDNSLRKLKQVQFGIRATKAQVEPMIKEVLSQFPCFKIKENKRKCKLEADETTVSKGKLPKKCSELKRNQSKFEDLSVDQESAYDDGVNECGVLQDKISAVQDLEEKVLTIKQMGRDLGVALVENYSAYAGFSGLVVVNSKEKEEGDFPSTIKFNDTKTKIEVFSLGVNFGSGYKEYSLVNGGISNLVYDQTARGTSRLRFAINGDYKIEAELSVTSEVIILHKSGASYTNIRLKGTTKNTFSDGKIRKGVMALQIDTVD